MELLVLVARTFSTISSVLIQIHYTNKQVKQPYTQTFSTSSVPFSDICNVADDSYGIT